MPVYVNEFWCRIETSDALLGMLHQRDVGGARLLSEVYLNWRDKNEVGDVEFDNTIKRQDGLNYGVALTVY